MKRNLLPLLGLLLIVPLLTACPSSATLPRQLPDPSPALLPEELDALSAIREFFSVSQSVGEDIWPGFRLHEEAFLVFRPGERSFLVNPQNPPESLEEISVPGLPARVFVIPAGGLRISAGLPFQKGFLFLDNRVMLARHTRNMPRETFYRLVVHETFHDYQARAFPAESTLPVCRYPYEDTQRIFLARVEDGVLANTVGLLVRVPVDLAQVRDSFSLFLGLRQSRFRPSGQDDAMRDIELREERVEGTARYVETMYAVEAGYTTLRESLAQLSMELMRFSPSNLQKWKYYRTGLALALVLDALSLPHWKARCQEGQCLYPFAAEALNGEVAEVSKDQRDQQVKRSRVELQEVESGLSQYLQKEADLLEKWAKEGHFRVEIRVPEKGTAYYSSRGVTFETSDCNRFISGILSWVDSRYGLQISGRGAMVRHGEQGYVLWFYHDLSQGRMRLDGQEISLEDGQVSFSDSLQVSFQGFQWSVRGSGEVRVSGRDCVIQLRQLAQ